MSSEGLNYYRVLGLECGVYIGFRGPASRVNWHGLEFEVTGFCSNSAGLSGNDPI